MTRRTPWILIGLACAAGLVAVLAAPAVRLQFRVNELQYLKRAHRYREAIERYESLRRGRPGLETRLGPFERTTAEAARKWYTRPYRGRNPAEDAEYARFEQAAEARPELAAIARRLRLERLVSAEPRSTTATLEAARAILTHEGFDREALWWTVRLSYDPADPLAVPDELIRPEFKEELETPAAPDVDFAADPAAAAWAERRILLLALRELAARDWAAAASHFDQYRRLSASLAAAMAPAHGLTLLRSGQPARAAALWQAMKAAGHAPPCVRGWTAEAWLACGDWPWAAQALDDLAAQGRPAIEAPLRAAFGLAGSAAPVETLLGSIGRPGALAGAAGLWEILGPLVGDARELSAWHEAALTLAPRLADNPESLATLAGGLLRAGQAELAVRILAPQAADLAPPAADLAPQAADLAPPATDAAGAAQMPADHVADAREALANLCRWQADPAHPENPPGLRARVPVSLLLSAPGTHRVRLSLAPDATLAVLMVQGYPASGIWPIVRADFGQWGAATFYAGQTRARITPLPLALRPGAAAPAEIDVTLSLLNGEAEGRESRSLMIAEILIF